MGLAIPVALLCMLMIVADFRPERAWGDGRMDKQTHKKKAPVFYRSLSPSGPLPKKGYGVTMFAACHRDKARYAATPVPCRWARQW